MITAKRKGHKEIGLKYFRHKVSKKDVKEYFENEIDDEEQNA